MFGTKANYMGSLHYGWLEVVLFPRQSEIMHIIQCIAVNFLSAVMNLHTKNSTYSDGSDPHTVKAPPPHNTFLHMVISAQPHQLIFYFTHSLTLHIRHATKQCRVTATAVLCSHTLSNEKDPMTVLETMIVFEICACFT